MIPALIAIAGVGLTAAGAYNQYQGAKGASEAQQKQIALEQKAEAQRRLAMEIKARRDQLEAVRQGQRARALGLVSATNQGAGQGSGLQGAYGQISGQVGTNILGITQPLEIGRNIFDINEQISQQKIAMAQAGTQSSFGQGLSSLGSSLLANSNQISSAGTFLAGKFRG